MSEYIFDNKRDKELKIAEVEIERRHEAGQLYTLNQIKKAVITTQKDTKEYDLGFTKNRKANTSNSGIVSLKFNATNFLDEDGEIENTEEFELELATCSVKKQKNVVITPIMNENASIKQITGSGDYDITIQGLLVGNMNYKNEGLYNTEYAKPTQDLETLHKILNTDVSLSITSEFLNNLGIYNIVILDYVLPQDFKQKNIQNFRIRAVSDDENITAI